MIIIIIILIIIVYWQKVEVHILCYLLITFTLNKKSTHKQYLIGKLVTNSLDEQGVGQAKLNPAHS